MRLWERAVCLTTYIFYWQDQLHEYLGLMQALHAAFADRSNALLTVQTLVSDLASLNTRVEKLTLASSKIFGGDKSRIRKVEELKEAVKVADESRDYAQREYDCIKVVFAQLNASLAFWFQPFFYKTVESGFLTR